MQDKIIMKVQHVMVFRSQVEKKFALSETQLGRSIIVDHERAQVFSCLVRLCSAEPNPVLSRKTETVKSVHAIPSRQGRQQNIIQRPRHGQEIHQPFQN